MSREMEDRLRAAYQAKADQVTDRRLAQLRAERDSQLATLFSEDVPIARLEHPPVQLDSRRQRHSRWFAPAVAAAAVAAVAAIAFVLSTPVSHRTNDAPPASRASSPTASASPSVTDGPTRNGGPSSVTGTGTGPGYLPAGQTGAVQDVPWDKVGPGWRLVQPTNEDGSSIALYLYDPAAGRYLITDQLPKSAYLQAWSPDGERAMFTTPASSSDFTQLRQLDLHSGQLAAGFSQYLGQFLTYTQPQGLAVLVTGQVQGDSRLLRYGTDGTMQLAYPPTIGGQQLRGYDGASYTADGSQLAVQAGNNVVLLTNAGDLVRQYPLPASYQSCRPMKWWSSDNLLEACEKRGSVTALYLQPVDGGDPSVLVDQESPIGLGYGNGWQLSNGDVLLARMSGCGSAGYDILHPDGTTVPLRLPAGVPEPGTIIAMSGDLATFQVVHGCGDPGTNVSLLDYNMVTGATSTLLNSNGIVLSYPGNG
jgi:hypothetical protein